MEKIKVVIIDDNIDLLDILKEFLEQQDDIRVVGIANNGLNAMRIIKASKPDVVILDIIMPVMDGISVLKAIETLSLDKNPIFIILSRIDKIETVNNTYILGAHNYILKPFDLGVLLARIRELYSISTTQKLLQHY